MAFWGIEVKPGNPITHSFDKVRRRLRISQATLGIGSAMKKSLVQCNVGKKSPVFLCALLPDKTESCHLDLEFEETDDVVFSVLGPRSVYLTGYYVSNDRHSTLNSDTESYGEDIANTETDESGQHGDEDQYEDSFIDDGDPVVSPSLPVPSDGVDEDMLEKKKIRERKGSKRLQRKKFQISDSDEETPQGSEDDDNYPLFLFKSKKDAKHKVPVVGEEIGRVTVETNENTPNCGTSGHVSKEKTDAVATQTEPKGKNLQCDASFPSGEVKPKKETELNESRNLIKEAEIFEDKFANNSEALVDDEIQKNIAKVDNICENPSGKEDYNSEFGPLNNKKSKRKRKEHSDEAKTLERSTGNHRKTLKQEKTLKAETEADNKHQYVLQQNEPNQKPTANMDIGGEGHSSLLPIAGSENGPSSKKRRKKGAIKDRSHESNDATSNKILVNDQLKQNVVEDDKMVRDLPATTAEDKKPIVDNGTNLDFVADGLRLEKPKRKKKKDKTPEDKENLNVSESLLCANKTRKPSMSCQVRTLSNGLVIEELALGEQDGKVAALGRKVKVYYTAMLKESGHVFYSNTGKAPYKFRLGDEAVIGGWNVGLEGMCVGSKRRLIIPPSMGYGSQGAGENVPPNSWLVYDVELAGVR